MYLTLTHFGNLELTHGLSFLQTPRPLLSLSLSLSLFLSDPGCYFSRFLFLYIKFAFFNLDHDDCDKYDDDDYYEDKFLRA
jgi:hypothetical protein